MRESGRCWDCWGCSVDEAEGNGNLGVVELVGKFVEIGSGEG